MLLRVPPRRALKRVIRAVRGATAAGKRRVRLDNDARRAQLLGLARKAFSDRAYDDVSVDDLAKEAKISKGLLYHYFPTKRDLYVAGLSEIADELVRAVTSVSGTLPPIERARGGLDAYLDHITRHQRAFVSLMRGGIGSDPEVAAVVDGVRAKMYSTFLEDQPFAPLVKGDPRFEMAVKGWIGFVEATTIEWCANPRLTREQLRELLVSVLLSVLQLVSPNVFRMS